MRGWYSIHDYTAMKIGFVPYKDSYKHVPEFVGNHRPTEEALLTEPGTGKKSEDKLKPWMIFLIVFFSIGAVVFTVTFIYIKCCRDKNLKT